MAFAFEPMPFTRFYQTLYVVELATGVPSEHPGRIPIQ
jgi:hypothetical protein